MTLEKLQAMTLEELQAETHSHGMKLKMKDKSDTRNPGPSKDASHHLAPSQSVWTCQFGAPELVWAPELTVV